MSQMDGCVGIEMNECTKQQMVENKGLQTRGEWEDKEKRWEETRSEMREDKRQEQEGGETGHLD